MTESCETGGCWEGSFGKYGFENYIYRPLGEGSCLKGSYRKDDHGQCG